MLVIDVEVGSEEYQKSSQSESKTLASLTLVIGLGLCSVVWRNIMPIVLTKLVWILCGLISLILSNPSRSRVYYSIVLPLENH